MTPSRTEGVALLRHAGVAVLAVVLMAVGLVLVGQRGDGFVTTASAVVGPHLQIAHEGSQDFGSSVEDAWDMAGTAPGDAVLGAVVLRTAGLSHPERTSLRLRAVIPAAPESPVAHWLVVTDLRLGQDSLAHLWPAACLDDGRLTLAALATCPSPPALPVPAPGAGTRFGMVIMVDPPNGNLAQDASLANVQFAFTLEDSTPDESDPGPGLLPAATGQIVLRYDTADPAHARLFTLTVHGPGGVSGPGPEQHSGALELNVAHTLSLTGPQSVQGANFRLTAVECESSLRGRLAVPQAPAFELVLTGASEVVTCTFHGALAPAGSSPAASPSVVPGPPATGTGISVPAQPGGLLLVLGGLLAAGWASAMAVLTAGRLRPRDRS